MGAEDPGDETVKSVTGPQENNVREEAARANRTPTEQKNADADAEGSAQEAVVNSPEADAAVDRKHEDDAAAERKRDDESRQRYR